MQSYREYTGGYHVRVGDDGLSLHVDEANCDEEGGGYKVCLQSYVDLVEVPPHPGGGRGGGVLAAHCVVLSID